MFLDEALIYVKAGDGGNGVVAFRHEAHVPRAAARVVAMGAKAAMFTCWPILRSTP